MGIYCLEVINRSELGAVLTGGPQVKVKGAGVTKGKMIPTNQQMPEWETALSDSKPPSLTAAAAMFTQPCLCRIIFSHTVSFYQPLNRISPEPDLQAMALL